jgi:hypothetical protein
VPTPSHVGRSDEHGGQRQEERSETGTKKGETAEGGRHLDGDVQSRVSNEVRM